MGRLLTTVSVFLLALATLDVASAGCCICSSGSPVNAKHQALHFEQGKCRYLSKTKSIARVGTASCNGCTRLGYQNQQHFLKEKKCHNNFGSYPPCPNKKTVQSFTQNFCPIVRKLPLIPLESFASATFRVLKPGKVWLSQYGTENYVLKLWASHRNYVDTTGPDACTEISSWYLIQKAMFGPAGRELAFRPDPKTYEKRTRIGQIFIYLIKGWVSGMAPDSWNLSKDMKPRVGFMMESGVDGDLETVCLGPARCDINTAKIGSPHVLQRLIVELVDVMTRLHALGFTHGDIKPDNFMFREDQVNLIDFGTTRKVGVKGTCTNNGIFQPDLTQGFFSNDQDVRFCDMYGIGAMIQVFVQGRGYFNRDDDNPTTRNHDDGDDWMDIVEKLQNPTDGNTYEEEFGENGEKILRLVMEADPPELE